MMLRPLLLTLAICVAFVASQGGPSCSNGTTDDDCNGWYCPLEPNKCVPKMNGGESCKCKHDVGVPTILCGEDDDKFTSLCNDPRAKSYDGESIDVILPCEYLVTHFRTTKPFMDRNITCEFEVFAANRRIKGKQFVSGFAIIGYTTGYFEDIGYTYMVDGEASNGQYCFWSDLICGDDLCTSNGSYAVQYGQDFAQNLAIVDSSVCGFRAAFRPADDQLGKDQKWLPGFALKIEGGVAVEYLSTNEVVALPEGFTVASSGPEDRPAVDILTYRAIISHAPQQFKWKSGMCNYIKDVFKDCENQRSITHAMNMCKFAINPSPFLKCYSEENDDKKSQKILQLYEFCVESRCTRSQVKCNQLKRRINAHPKCKKKLEALDEEILRDNCQFGVAR